VAGFIQLKLNHSFVLSTLGGQVAWLAISVDHQLRVRLFT